jgi:hypothetical protein
MTMKLGSSTGPPVPTAVSTAITLRDMNPLAHQHGIVRHRSLPRTHRSTSTLSEEHDTCIRTSPEIQHSASPPLAPSLIPTATYWVSTHGLFTKKTTIQDVIRDLDGAYPGLTDTYKAEVLKALKDHSIAPAFTCQSDGWYKLTYTITNDQEATIAQWKHTWSSVGEAILTFPQGSPHSSHPVSLGNRQWGSRDDRFVLGSQPFSWESDSVWHDGNMTLYKISGSSEQEVKREVSKYAQKSWLAFVTGGTVVVDEKEIDGLVACLTLLVVLEKKRQRAAERRTGV